MEKVIHLKNFEFLIRPIKPEDGEELQKSLGKLSSSSIDQRFFAIKKSFSNPELDFLTKVDDINHLAYVAISTGKDAKDSEGAGVIRAIRDSGNQHNAEIAITIIDKFQGIGLGHALLSFLSERAMTKDIHFFSGALKRTNTPMMRLLSKFQNFKTSSPEKSQSGDSVINFVVTLPFAK